MEALELDPASEEIREVTGALTSAAHFEQQHNP